MPASHLATADCLGGVTGVFFWCRRRLSIACGARLKLLLSSLCSEHLQTATNLPLEGKWVPCLLC